jgi:uncharacterized lipoprotein
MRLNVPTRSASRLAVATLVLVAIAAGSGCSWFRKEDKLYAGSPESRPLEVPPDLDLPRTDAAVAVPSASAMASSTAAPAAGVSGFTVAGTREEIFGKVGDALGKVEGLTIASRAQAIGVYDVSFEGSNFLVRVSTTTDGTNVSAVDPRGLPAGGEAPVKLMAQLKTALGGN